METWAVQSPDTPGFHKVITPDTCECKAAQIFRLNLPAGESYVLESGELEMNAAAIYGCAKLSENAELTCDMDRFDAFYIPAETSVKITAVEDLVLYIGAAKFEGIGKINFRKFDITLPLGDVHQIHGSGRGRREVMFTCAPQDEASALICGLTWGGDGSWTSWPPHQHEKDLEEVYCYFDIPAPKFGLHLSYLKSGE
ncbi:MAG: 5-deoxy-glucuronate isomerase, partial [Lachnospiraceae bacterium]|nr:5-deoxy-glucuronate isomerase [Lachnospiraceae bacterium]